MSMNNLASTLEGQGNLVEARKLQEETLTVFRRLLGPEHPNSLASMNNLAQTLKALGDLAGARKLQEQALAVSRRVLGPEHPNTSNSAWSLFITLQNLGEHGAAREVLKQNLVWLLERDPGSLGAVQRKIRIWVAEAAKADRQTGE